jgi:glucose-1-phosphate adenylyltransferase
MISASVLAFVMAGGNGTRLKPLTDALPKPALPIAGRHRLIDFVLSNLYNSEIRTVYVLLQYRPQPLLEHLATHWTAVAGECERFVQPVLPRDTPACAEFLGTAHAVHQCLHLVEKHAPDLVAVFAADHIYRMDVRQMTRFHVQSGADATLAAVQVPIEEASLFGIIEVDARNQIRRFDEKPLRPQQLRHAPGMAYASMGNYLFRRDVLERALRAAVGHGETDFGRHVIPRMIRDHAFFAYDVSENVVPGLQPHEERAYWRDVGTLPAYIAAHRDLLGSQPKLVLANDRWPIRGAAPSAYPEFSTVLKRAPTSVASTTSVVETPIMMMPSAESLPHSPSSANFRI